MSIRKHNENTSRPVELDTVIARARRERDAHIRKMFGALFGR